MNPSSNCLDALREAIVNPTNAIVGIVDNVLVLCRQHHLQLDWREDQCNVRCAGSDKEEVLKVPLRKSVFRAILARIATLCSERVPDSFSPYGGDGELWIGSDSKTALQASWINTTQEQRLRLMPLGGIRASQKEAAAATN